MRGCSDRLSNILGISCNTFGVTKPNANLKAITDSINISNENLTEDDVIICGGTRYVAKNGLRALSEFAKLTTCANVIVTGVHITLICSCHHVSMEKWSHLIGKYKKQ